jgi:hypothetical protein
MLTLPKILGVVFLLTMGLSTVVQAGETPLPQRVTPVSKTIQGEVVRVEGDNCVIKDQNGKEVRLQIDLPLLKATGIEPGERIEAKVNDQNDVLSFRTGVTDR